MYRFGETRNQFAKLEAGKRARKPLHICKRCPAMISGSKIYCLPCAADAYDEHLIARRLKARNHAVS